MISHGELHEIDEIIALTKACGLHMRENGIDQWDENYPDRLSITNDLTGKTLFTYREGKVILGIVVLNEHQDEEYAEINWSTSESDRNIVVHRLAVHPDHQGKGIARKIMDFAEQFAREEEYDAIRLDTFSQNPRNQRFYTNRGYTDLGAVYLKYKKDHPYYCYELLIK
ncbi:MAG: GNAT family N-acetyltransferase [Crocinitomicaceae bacterium]|nr:GNAT family N-acetyltransferase [Crocinitomicaceae bacterium]